ncbi:MAG: PIN domain-containing protein [Verrucomicrobiae bacterium]|nr:PIN domain-containing protein [Verrucomicrobiae bacterium]
MRILIDCDVLLDVALERAEHWQASAAILDWAEKRPGLAAVAWHSLANLFYLCRGDVRGFVRDLLEFVEVAPVSTLAMRHALNYAMSDLEDAMQAAAAVSFGALFIVSRNYSDYRRSPIKAMSPIDFCRQHNK